MLVIVRDILIFLTNNKKVVKCNIGWRNGLFLIKSSCLAFPIF